MKKYLFINKKHKTYTDSDTIQKHNITRKYGITHNLTDLTESELLANGFQYLTKEIADTIKSENGLTTSKNENGLTINKKSIEKIKTISQLENTDIEKEAFKESFDKIQQFEKLQAYLKELKQKEKEKRKAQSNFDRQKEKNKTFIIGFNKTMDLKLKNIMDEIAKYENK